MNEIKNIFQTYSRSLEILYVHQNIKQVTRMCFPEIQIEKIKNYCAKNNLYFEKSDFKVFMDFSGNYSTKGSIIDKDSKLPGYFFVYIGKKKENVIMAKNSEQEHDIKKLGQLLGYPDCCIDFFIKNKPIEEIKNNDYVIPALENSNREVYPYYLNVFGRHFDFVYLEYCPCSFECEKSIEIAKIKEKVIDCFTPQLKKMIKYFLKSAIIYEDGVIHLIRDYCLIEKKNEKQLVYQNILSSKQTNLGKILENHSKLILNKNTNRPKEPGIFNISNKSEDNATHLIVASDGVFKTNKILGNKGFLLEKMVYNCPVILFE